MFRPTRLRAPSSLSGATLARRPQGQQQQFLAQPSPPHAPTAAATVAVAALPGSRRRIHHMPISRHKAHVGVPNLLSPEGFDMAWTQHMSLMLARLNQLVAGTDYEERDLKGIIVDSARIPSLAAVFNHASMAHNTDFFFKQLRSSASEPLDGTPAATAAADRMPASLRVAIEDSFGSVATLRREFVATASAMFGPDDLPRGLAAVDMNTVGAEVVAATTPGAAAGSTTTPVPGSEDAARQWLNRQAAAIASPHGTPGTDRRPPGGIDVIPLLCVSTWEHVWLRDYGLGATGEGGGKTAFVEAWWDAVDWDAVADLANLNRLKLKT
ncbi:superoxide dismutase [Niveomyces insectorum RCEF 264]|uniref:Superoxide dismutase n=1 Tax=Niveomyces insectorum RCEF 264 TaxID=1081102 RepID=A0A168AE49_9HYPO|nr:superoxide dismutase [Niveomyces insectorum RCEF 264]